MGTHISRVKSVDLDSWTEEQMQSILSWGNARSNKYWEAKLAVGHAPSEAKIENFIRTKYEMKRWVMDGPMPDPSTLGVEGDDDVPLSVVKEKQAIDRSELTRKASLGQKQPGRHNLPPPETDLIGGDDPSPARATSAGPSGAGAPPKAESSASKPTNTKDSLLGLDFLGGGGPATPRPASTTGVSSQGAQSRPDLKQSILSLYASAPRQPVQPQQAPPQQQASFGAMNSPQMGQQQPQSTMGGFNDAFGSLSMSNATNTKQSAADPFASLGSAPSKRGSQAAAGGGFGSLGSGSFFASKPAQAPQSQSSNMGGADGWGSFATQPLAATSTASQPARQPASSAMGDLFDLSSPVTTTTSPPPTNRAPSVPTNSVFNLSSPQSQAPPAHSPLQAQSSAAMAGFGVSGADVWGGNAWASNETATTPGTAAASMPATQRVTSPALTKAPSNDFGWGSSGGSFANTPIVPGSTGGFNPAPKVTADEEFGGWTGSTGASNTTTTTASGGSKSAGGGDEDLFSNVWG